MHEKRPIGRFTTRAALAVWMSLVFVSCGPAGSDHKGCADLAPGDEVLRDQSMTVCSGSVDVIRGGRAQVLLDASGSMEGFSHVVPEVLDWVSQGISRVDGSSLRIDGGRVCQFSKTMGIGNCSGLTQKPSPFQGRGSTNLHEAIASSKDFELTFLLTDGVGAAGEGTGDCAHGVDAACVARAFQETLKEFNLAGSDPDPGIWVVPLIARFDGPYYTERKADVLKFDPGIASERVRLDMGVEPSIGKPFLNGDGTIVYDYRGPRAMILVVIARWTEAGRQAVAALWERMPNFDVHPLDTITDVPDGVGALPPLEVVPGALAPITWSQVEEVDAPVGIGAVDAEILLDSGTLRLSCHNDGSESSQDLFRLTGERPRQSGTCVEIQQLPAFRIAVTPVGEAAQTDSGLFAYEVSRLEESTAELQVCLGCGNTPLPQCGEGTVEFSFGVTPEYELWTEGEPSGFRLIRDISTVEPLSNPHRAYDLESVFQIFYQDYRQHDETVRLSSLNICR